MSTGKVVLGTLAGLAIGAIAGILFAPEKGSVTRKQIMDKGDDYVDKMKSKYDEISDSIAEKFENTKRDVENLADKGKAKYDEAKREVKNSVSDNKHTMS
jgi:gas vesicle protein